MRSFLAILFGSYLANFTYINTTYYLSPKDSGSPWPYAAGLTVFFIASLFFSSIARYGLRVFAVREENFLTLGIIFFIAQLFVYVFTEGLFRFGIVYALPLAIFICAFGGAFALRLIKGKS